MQVNINSNYTQRVSFESLKKIKFSGAYKNNPRCQIDLMKAIDSNKSIENFYKDYDVDIVFDTYKTKDTFSSFMEFYCKKQPTNLLEKIKAFFELGYYMEVNTFDQKSSNNMEATEKLVEKIRNSGNRFQKAKLMMNKIVEKKSSIK